MNDHNPDQSARIAELERLHLEAIDEQAAQANIMRELERRVQELTEENEKLQTWVKNHAEHPRRRAQAGRGEGGNREGT